MKGEVMEGCWSGDGDDDGDDLPSPEAKTTSRLALSEKNRGWQRLRDENWENDFCSGISSRQVKIGAKVGHQRGWDPPRRPPSMARGRQQGTWGPSGSPLPHLLVLGPSGCMDFLYFFWAFSEVPKNPYSCTQENHTGSFAENNVSPG